MSKAHETGPERTVRYPLTWPAWLAERVAEAARARMMPMAVWLREAAVEKLERTEGQSDVNRAGRLTQDEPRHLGAKDGQR